MGHILAILVGGGPGDHLALPTFHLARFAEGKPIRGTYGDWLMCQPPRPRRGSSEAVGLFQPGEHLSVKTFGRA